MRQLMIRLMSVLLILGVLVGCNTDNSQSNNDLTTSEEVQEEQITVLITKNEGEETVAEKEISIEEGDILMDVLKEHFEIEEEGGFINKIDGVGAEEGENAYWVYTVNGEMAEVGAAEFELSADDQVHFDLTNFD